MPVTLLVNELLTNALKHAFPDQRSGHIRISIQSTDGVHELVFFDSGATWNENEHVLESTFGLQLIAILAEQLDGVVERTHAHGNRFRLTFGEAKALRRAS